MQMFGHRSPVTAADEARLAEELAEAGLAIGIAERACCCPARPVIRAVMPAAAGRPERVDLLLCGHHYRAGQTALIAAGAAVYDARGLLIAGAPARRRPRLRIASVTARALGLGCADWGLGMARGAEGHATTCPPPLPAGDGPVMRSI
jgi:hypothetical protein